jgi:hypothetical protein
MAEQMVILRNLFFAIELPYERFVLDTNVELGCIRVTRETRASP